MSAYPLPKPPVIPEALPELVTVQCQACEGTGYGETHSGETVKCGMCDGASTLEVCSVCGEQPEVENGIEICACNRRCELCGRLGPLNRANICKPCSDHGEIELELSRSQYESWQAEEIAWGRSIGWL